MRNTIRKIWREQRVRRAVCLTITVVYSLSLIVLFNARVEIQEGMVLTPKDEVELAAQFAAFDVFISERWAETMLFAILAVFFAVGGILDERKTDSLHFTLGLPVARSAWLRAQAVVGGLSLLVLIISSILIIWALGDASLGRMAMAGLVQWLTGLCILCAVFVSGALTRSGIIQFLVGMAVIVFLGVVRHPWNLFESPATIILTGAFPTGLVVTALLFILGTYALAERRLRTLDF